MRTMKTMFVAIVVVLCAGIASAQTQTGETLEMRIERLKAQKTEAQGNESLRERQIRERAEEIKAERSAKDAEKERRENDSDEMRQARREAEKAEKKDKKAEDGARKALTSVDLLGCDPATVWISPDIGNRSGLKSSYLYSMSLVTVVNRRPVPVSITSTLHGALIRNLCSGGSVTLTFAARPNTGGYEQIVMTAISQSAGSGTRTDSRNISVYPNRDLNSRQITSDLWELREW